ncbi:MAG: hypothetical protein HC839_02485 [Leptolyngbyaceae cyanobacterium RM2_2_21]|nr:hypothetical protein [Leptolyngbyaceae cyanobacterium RM2_2_21]
MCDDVRMRFTVPFHFCCQQHNVVSRRTVARVVRQAQRRCYQVSSKADKFLNDLNAEIELGWTDTGQTNYLLGRITMRCYIFHHVLQGGEPLQGQQLIDQIVAIAKALPGYRQWCQHQFEIEKRAAEWACCIENSRYFPYGAQQGKYKAKQTLAADEISKTASTLTWNQRQIQAVRQKIQAAISDLLAKQNLPEKATARFKCLAGYGIGGSSLYRHTDLWHPSFWTPPQLTQTASVKKDGCLDRAEGASKQPDLVSLLPATARNVLQAKDCGDRPPVQNTASGASGRNSALAQTSAQLGHLLQNLQHQSQARRQQFQSYQQSHQEQKRVRQQRQWAERMQDYLHSDDPILLGEALDWAIASSTRLEQVSRRLQAFCTQADADSLSLLADIFSQLLRLRWTPEQIKRDLSQQVGKTAIAHLSTAERQVWLNWLTQQSEPP